MAPVPFKAHIQIIGAELDDDGDIISEFHAGELTLHAKQFSELDAKIAEAWPQVVSLHAPSPELAT